MKRLAGATALGGPQNCLIYLLSCSAPVDLGTSITVQIVKPGTSDGRDNAPKASANLSHVLYVQVFIGMLEPCRPRGSIPCGKTRLNHAHGRIEIDQSKTDTQWSIQLLHMFPHPPASGSEVLRARGDRKRWSKGANTTRGAKQVETYQRSTRLCTLTSAGGEHLSPIEIT